mmetsp:Transcript_3763/g.5671  ORF Transcript_3763/g.5671 Transcript_3763/m.5671 type:complete len:220 (-) Transcript_3763:709-1368(-)
MQRRPPGRQLQKEAGGTEGSRQTPHPDLRHQRHMIKVPVEAFRGSLEPEALQSSAEPLEQQQLADVQAVPGPLSSPQQPGLLRQDPESGSRSQVAKSGAPPEQTLAFRVVSHGFSVPFLSVLGQKPSDDQRCPSKPGKKPPGRFQRRSQVGRQAFRLQCSSDPPPLRPHRQRHTGRYGLKTRHRVHQTQFPVASQKHLTDVGGCVPRCLIRFLIRFLIR